jgi:hypothetical protein
MHPAWLVPLLLLLPNLAFAHSIGVSRGVYSLQGGTVHAQVLVARPDAASLWPGRDPSDLTGDLSVLAGLRVQVGAVACPPVTVHTTLVEGDGVQIDASWHCPPGPRARLTFGWLDALSHGHRHLPQIQGEPPLPPLYRGQATLEIPAQTSTPAEQDTWPQRALGFLRMGIEHILSGPDHLLFLLGLVLLGGSWRSLLGVVTAFTVAHSLSLGLSVLDLWTPGARVIEPLIGLSIAWVGMENLWLQDASGRWRLAAPFGLIHGFGLASALREVHLAPVDAPLALLSFNLGVEVGQLAVLAVILPGLAWLRRRGWLERPQRRWWNGGLITAGLAWFIARIAL